MGTYRCSCNQQVTMKATSIVLLSSFVVLAFGNKCAPGVGDCDDADPVKPPETCTTHSKCSSCVADLHCGWCASEATCTKGGVAGPAASNCTTWDYAFCSGEPCAAYGECDSCTADPLCGWCSTTGVCTEGSRERPVFIQCLARDWRHGPGACAKCQCPDANGACPSAKKELEKIKCAAPNKAYSAVKKNADLNADSDEEEPAKVGETQPTKSAN